MYGKKPLDNIFSTTLSCNATLVSSWPSLLLPLSLSPSEVSLCSSPGPGTVKIHPLLFPESIHPFEHSITVS